MHAAPRMHSQRCSALLGAWAPPQASTHIITHISPVPSPQDEIRPAQAHPPPQNTNQATTHVHAHTCGCAPALLRARAAAPVSARPHLGPPGCTTPPACPGPPAGSPGSRSCSRQIAATQSAGGLHRRPGRLMPEAAARSAIARPARPRLQACPLLLLLAAGSAARRHRPWARRPAGGRGTHAAGPGAWRWRHGTQSAGCAPRSVRAAARRRGSGQGRGVGVGAAIEAPRARDTGIGIDGAGGGGHGGANGRRSMPVHACVCVRGVCLCMRPYAHGEAAHEPRKGELGTRVAAGLQQACVQNFHQRLVRGNSGADAGQGVRGGGGPGGDVGQGDETPSHLGRGGRGATWPQLHAGATQGHAVWHKRGQMPRKLVLGGIAWQYCAGIAVLLHAQAPIPPLAFVACILVRMAVCWF